VRASGFDLRKLLSDAELCGTRLRSAMPICRMMFHLPIADRSCGFHRNPPSLEVVQFHADLTVQVFASMSMTAGHAYSCLPTTTTRGTIQLKPGKDGTFYSWRTRRFGHVLNIGRLGTDPLLICFLNAIRSNGSSLPCELYFLISGSSILFLVKLSYPVVVTQAEFEVLPCF